MLGPMKLPYSTLFAFFRSFVYPTTHTCECQADSCATAVRTDKSSRSRALSLSLALSTRRSFSACATRALVCQCYVRRQPLTI